jgi:quercetin dioxygenase-like cupin family protein
MAIMNHFIELKSLAATEALKDALLSAVNTENLTIAYTDMKAGVEIPLHHHPEEAVDIILEGILEMQIGEKTGTLTHGMISIVPSNAPHKAKAITGCRVITIFYPKRPF